MHFTYSAVAEADLRQGDLLKRTPDVEAILKEVHPHYHSKSDYRYFLVLTQSCDLVRRSGTCASHYVSICAVRPFEVALTREATRLQYTEIERALGICNEKQKAKLYQFVERLLNNNEDRYFYLQREPSAGLHEDYCAFLQLSVSLKASLHYATLLAARVLSLTESFQHKLGYLVGTGYSRVGTRDWVPDTDSREQFEKRRTEPVDGLKTVNWLQDSVHKQVLERLKGIAAEERTLEKLDEVLKTIQTSREVAVKAAVDSVHEAIKDLVDEADLRKVERRLRNSNSFMQSIRR